MGLPGGVDMSGRPRLLVTVAVVLGLELTVGAVRPAHQNRPCILMPTTLVAASPTSAPATSAPASTLPFCPATTLPTATTAKAVKK